MASIYEIAEAQTKEEVKKAIREHFPEMAGQYDELVDFLFEKYGVANAAEKGPKELLALFGQMRMAIVSKEIEIIRLKATVEFLKRQLQSDYSESPPRADN